jgi:hypothetical protein
MGETCAMCSMSPMLLGGPQRCDGCSVRPGEEEWSRPQGGACSAACPSGSLHQLLDRSGGEGSGGSGDSAGGGQGTVAGATAWPAVRSAVFLAFTAAEVGRDAVGRGWLLPQELEAWLMAESGLGQDEARAAVARLRATEASSAGKAGSGDEAGEGVNSTLSRPVGVAAFVGALASRAGTAVLCPSLPLAGAASWGRPIEVVPPGG